MREFYDDRFTVTPPSPLFMATKSWGSKWIYINKQYNKNCNISQNGISLIDNTFSMSLGDGIKYLKVIY